ncbi:TVP38/TMEM64 family protein [Corynebacterium pygosceleis]|uniref:TVP38/TMEM64 family protein n=1 Tax=Corynebacterium pygosceleis TaxID=2800406 RepID=UPI001F227F97|nr:TVP38/TMEM64 family protein [Corynebacterium pygosceleis]
MKRSAIIAFVTTAAAVALWTDVPGVTQLRSWAEATGRWFPVMFVGAYILVTQFPVPRTILTLTSGILFGPAMGILIALSATTMSAALSLVIMRNLLGDWIRPRLTHPSVTQINARLRERGWLAVASLRMIAVVPFSVLNYTAALTPVTVPAFTLATLIGSAPGTIVTVILGDALTGQANPAVVIGTVVLTLVGVTGLVVDSRLPVDRPLR